ncbi:imelysin family protein [uncultured Cytophaga sp.]|uniref:imelysin family protein n=1 Tax=uncultured Cytophaga sp. TaxID=160238 RepID=UPI0026250952|nr:imelysin family protein [uncultured Cytophaga sp.]
MSRLKRILLLVCIAIIGCIVSCKPRTSDNTIPAKGNDSDRSLMLVNIADNIILPTYANFDLKLTDMISKSDAFRNAPTEVTLTEFRTAWADAYIEWQKAALFDFGPATDYTLNSFLNLYPTNVSAIQANITAGNANLENFSFYSAQGFPALDYLINGIATSDADIVSLYDTDIDAAKRNAYLLKLTNQMRLKFDGVNNAWKNNYRNTFIASTGNGVNASTSVMVNGIVYYYERFLRSGKFGIPSGAMVNGTLLPGNVEAYYSKALAKTLAETAHQSFVDFFNGKGVNTGITGPSLFSYLNALDAKDATTSVLISKEITTQFDVVKTKLDALTGEDLSNEVSTQNANMIAVYNQMQIATRMLKVDMCSALSITITYTDNDGD